MSPEEQAEYQQIYLDETEEELDHLVERLLALESNPESREDLNEAFRMVHSMKGAAGMMGFDDVTSLTHLLESRFEKIRSGTLELDQATTNVALSCVDYLRDCCDRLRGGQDFESPVPLMNQLEALDDVQPESTDTGLDEGQSENQASAAATVQTEPEPTASESSSPELVPPSIQTAATGETAATDETAATEIETNTPAESLEGSGEVQDADGEDEDNDARDHDGQDRFQQVRITVKFEEGLQLLDMKGQLIVTRLSEVAQIESQSPTLEELAEISGPATFALNVRTNHDRQTIEEAVDVHGVAAIDLQPGDATHLGDSEVEDVELADESVETSPTEPPTESPTETVVGQAIKTETSEPQHREPVAPPSATSPVPASASAKTKPVETVRVDIDRLDNLLNLAGELVVNKARFSQIAQQMRPVFKRNNQMGHIQSINENLQDVLAKMKNAETAEERQQISIQLGQLSEELDRLQQRGDRWEQSRKCFGQIHEAIDQLSRVSDSLQRGVLQTRMVPVAPLFNRFKRVVRDLAMQKDKKINLVISGEKTELDKRMIDELGDPLVHLVRNSVDHGMETPQRRREIGKPEEGTIKLEATHSGNNVFIRIRDDGAGINVGKVRDRIVQRGLVTKADADGLSDAQVIDYIWSPGFSTAPQVTDISGRGVGMDIVRTRINELNGTVEVESVAGEGTTFTIRLPLTLAIINSLLFEISDIVYGAAIEDVREIVSLSPAEIVTIQRKQTFSIRGQYLPLVSVEDLFDWNGVDYRRNDANNGRSTPAIANRTKDAEVNVVVMQSGGRAIGLRVDHLLGSEDIVVKSLSENFVNIRGLSGASILGDGTVSLLLDIGTVIDLAVSSATSRRYA